MSEQDLNFEREKLRIEQGFREREIIIKQKEAAIREGELLIKQKEANRSLLSGPFNLAVVAATNTALTSIVVSCHNSSTQRYSEQSQSEHTLIANAINNTSGTPIDKLRFLAGVPLITNEETRKSILGYIEQEVQKSPPPTVQPPPSNAPIARISLSSDWLNGGHNQSEICGQLIFQARSQYPGKDVRLESASDGHRKDFLGHVTYKYTCNYAVF